MGSKVKDAATVETHNGVKAPAPSAPSGSPGLPDAAEPKDKGYLVYLIFLLHGIAVLMPWNMFITAFSYFVDYKLQPPPGEPSSDYQRFFMNYLGIVAQLPNVILNVVNLFVKFKGSVRPRILLSIIIMGIIFIITLILAAVDTSTWVVLFFWLTMASVMALNAATGVYQNSLFGLVALLPAAYTNAVITGTNISGTITTVVSMVTKGAFKQPWMAAIFYFLFALFLLVLALISFLLLPRIRFFRAAEQRQLQRLKGEEQELTSRKERRSSEIFAEGGDGVGSGGSTCKVAPAEAVYADNGGSNHSYLKPYLRVMKQAWVPCISVFLVFFVTLTNFPAIQLKISPQEDSYFPSSLFTDVTCFLAFNVMAVVGNFATMIIRYPGPRWIWLPCVLRLLFIPFFLLCRFDLDQRTFFPHLIDSDWVYFIGSLFHGFTSGYFSSLAMMYAPSLVEPHLAGTAGMTAALFLVLGIFSGCCSSLVIAKMMVSIGSGSSSSGAISAIPDLLTTSLPLPLISTPNP